MSLFITFEGCEGSGKSTQSKKLVENLNEQNFPSIWTREVGGTQAAEQIREIMLHQELNEKTEALLAMGARSEHIEQLIKPNLAAKKIVVCDRYVDSTAAYQGAHSAIGIDNIYNWHQQILANFMPEITFFMDVDPKKSLQRAHNRGDHNKFEDKNITFHQRTYEAFCQIAAKFPERIIRINADRPPEQIASEILCHVVQSLNFQQS